MLHTTSRRARKEAARAQGFPESYHLPRQKAAAMRMLGNAVPPPLMAGVLEQVVATDIMHREDRYDGPTPDLDFITHARADIPALLAYVRQLEERLAEVSTC
jgi:hypothetical protein